MTKKELRKIRRTELMELLLQQMKANEQLQQKRYNQEQKEAGMRLV